MHSARYAVVPPSVWHGRLAEQQSHYLLSSVSKKTVLLFWSTTASLLTSLLFSYFPLSFCISDSCVIVIRMILTRPGLNRCFNDKICYINPLCSHLLFTSLSVSLSSSSSVYYIPFCFMENSRWKKASSFPARVQEQQDHYWKEASQTGQAATHGLKMRKTQ